MGLKMGKISLNKYRVMALNFAKISFPGSILSIY